MKRKTLIIIIASLLLVGGGIALWFFFKKSNDLATYIPKDAVMVMKLDIPGMAQKVDMNKLKELNSFKLLRKEMNDNKIAKKMFDNFINDPSMIGIGFDRAPYMFLGVDSKGNRLAVYATYLFGVSNQKKFIDFITLVSGGMMDLKSEGSVKYITLEDDIEDGGLFFNDKVAMVVVKIEGGKVNCKNIAMNLFKMKADESILSEKTFTDFQKNQMDLSMYLNKSAIDRLVDENKNKMGSGKDLAKIKQFIKYYPVGMSMNFEEDAIKFKTYSDPAQTPNTEIMKDKGLSSADMKYFAPNGKPLAYLTLNLNVKKYYEMIMEVFKMDSRRNVEDIERGMDELTAETGVTKDQLLNTLAGNISVSLTGFEKKSYLYTSPYYMYDETYQPEPEMRTTMVPIFVAHATLGNASAYNYLVTKAQEQNMVADEVISFPTENETKEIIYIFKKGNDVMISNKLSYIEDFKNNVSWTALDASCKADMVAQNPMSFYVDMKYNTYKDVIADNASSSERLGMELILKEMDCGLAYANQKDGALELLMTPQKKNALWRIIEMIDNAVSNLN